MKRKWRENEEIERKWRKNEEIDREWGNVQRMGKWTENEEIKRKWREYEEIERKWRESNEMERRREICHKHHKQRLCKIISTRVKFHFVSVLLEEFVYYHVVFVVILKYYVSLWVQNWDIIQILE